MLSRQQVLKCRLMYVNFTISAVTGSIISNRDQRGKEYQPFGQYCAYHIAVNG